MVDGEEMEEIVVYDKAIEVDLNLYFDLKATSLILVGHRQHTCTHMNTQSRMLVLLHTTKMMLCFLL